MNERIKQIRKHFDLNQTDFGNKIGVKQGSVAAYESGSRIPLDSVVLSICREFNVNEHWLRTGEGEPYEQLQMDDTVAKAAALLGRHDPLFESIIEVYSKLNDSNKEVLLHVMEDLVNTYHSKKE